MLDEKYDGRELEGEARESSAVRTPDDALVTGAECLAALGQYTEARLQLDAALRINPSNSRAHTLAAAIQEAVVAPLVGEAATAFLANDLERAEELLLEVLDADPEHAQARRILASVRDRRATQPRPPRAISPTAAPVASAAEANERSAAAGPARTAQGQLPAGRAVSNAAVLVGSAVIALALLIVLSPRGVDETTATAGDDGGGATESPGPPGARTATDWTSAPWSAPLSNELAGLSDEISAGSDVTEEESGPAPSRSRPSPRPEEPSAPPTEAVDVETTGAAERLAAATATAIAARNHLGAGEWELTLESALAVAELAPGSEVLSELSREIVDDATGRAGQARLLAMSVGATEEATQFFADAVGLVHLGDETTEESVFVAARSYYVAADLFRRSAEAAQIDGIQAALDRYSAAHLEASMPRLRDLWPSLEGQDLVDIKRSFRSGKFVTMDLEPCSMRIGDGRALATCRVSQVYDPRFGPKRTTSSEYVFELRQEGVDWRIAGRAGA